MRGVQLLLSSVLLCGAIAFPLSARAEYVISVYGGGNFANDSDVDISNGPSTQSFDISWDGVPFEEGAPYYGVRGTYWLNDFERPNLGVAIDFNHAKVFADTLPAGVTLLEFTDGLNYLSANALYRFSPEDRFTPYVGAGGGISIPHVEYQEVGGPRTFEYQAAGGVVQALAGVDYALTDQFSVFGEYKLAYTFIDADLEGGGSLETDIVTHHLSGGLSFSFDLR